MTYSIFDKDGRNISDHIYRSELAASADPAFDPSTHVGINCEDHDEGEQGNCPFCRSEKPSDQLR